MSLRRSAFSKGMRDGIPIALGYFAVSFSFGIVAKKTGLSPFQAFSMSATNLTSAGQFAALGLISAAAAYLEMAATQLVINLRYCLMSCALSQKIDPKAPFFHRFLMAFGISDEIFGISIGQDGWLSPFYTYGAMSIAIPAWSFGTLLGVIYGGLLPERLINALGVALYGMFLAIILPPARRDKHIMGLVLLSMGLSAVFAWTPFLRDISDGMRIILLTILIAGGAAFLFPIKEGEVNGDEG